ncbi:MAG: hypothetical protein ACOH5I_17945 [Oligoflexus sp.]
MHPFLKKSGLFLVILLLFAAGVSWFFVSLFRHSLNAERDQQAAKLHLQQLHLDLLEQNISLQRHWLPLSQDNKIIDALDRETPISALQYIQEEAKRRGQDLDYIAIYDFDHDILISSFPDQNSLDQSVGRYFKAKKQKTKEGNLVFVNEKLLHLVFFPVGSNDKPAGYFALGKKWLPRYVSHDKEIHSFDWRVSIAADDELSEVMQQLDQYSFWPYQVLKDQDQVQMRVSTINQVTGLNVYFSLNQQDMTHSRGYFLLLASAIVLLLTLLGLSLISYLHYETYLPLEKLFLFITMLRDRNQFQKKPDFSGYPLFRRIANEVLSYLELIEEEKKSWQIKYFERQNKIECTQDLVKLNSCETRIWLQMTSELMKDLFTSFHRLKENQGLVCVRDLGSVFSLVKTLYQYQISFSVHQLARSMSKTQVALHRLGPKNRQLNKEDWDSLENLVYEVLTQLELCHEIIVEWLGYPDELQAFRYVSRPNADWFERLQAHISAINTDNHQNDSKIAMAMDNLLSELEVFPWADCQRRLQIFCSEYAQLYNKIPPQLHVSIQTSLPYVKWQSLLSIFPFMIETLGMLIEFSIEERWERVQAKKSESAKLSVEISEDAAAYYIVCQDDGRHLPIKTALAKMIPSGGFKLDEIDENQCWDLLNKIHLQDFARESKAPADELEFLIYLMKRFQHMGLTVNANGQREGGLILSVRILKVGILPSGQNSLASTEKRA